MRRPNSPLGDCSVTYGAVGDPQSVTINIGLVSVTLSLSDDNVFNSVGHVDVQRHFSVVKVVVSEYVTTDKSVNLLLYSLHHCTTVVVQY